MEKVNLSEVNNDNVVGLIQHLLVEGDVDTITNIWCDYNTKVCQQKFQEIQKLTDNSIYKEQIDNLIKAKFGIFS